MATNQNSGNQLLTVDYKLPIRSQRFNEFLRDLIYPGIYRGLEVTVIDTETIQISPGNIWFNAESGAGINVISVKVRTQSAFQKTVEPVNPVFYTRLTWANAEDNFAEFGFVADLNSLPTNALVICELIFDGGNNLIGVDYSNRSRGSLDWNNNGNLTTTLPPVQDYHIGNEKWNRDKYLNYISQPINGNRLITSISSNSTISGNTTVYESDIVITGNSVLIPYNVFINADLIVTGTTTTINSQTLEVEDKNIEIGKTPTPTDITADGGGITLKGSTDKTINWTQSGEQWNSSEHWNLVSGKEYRINGIKIIDSTSLGNGINSAPGLSQIGTITGGTWQADVIVTNYGGTGQSSYTDGEILIGRTSGGLAKKTIDGTPNRINVLNGDGTITLSTPQDIHSGASPTFAGLTLNGDINTNASTKRIFAGLGNNLLDIADSGSTSRIRGILEVSGNSILNSLDVIENSIELNKVTSPTNANADGGGIIVKGNSDKTFTYNDSGSKFWQSSENINLVSGKSYFINGVDVMSQALAKQDNLTNPYITISSVGVVNNLNITNNNYVKLSASTGLTGIVAPSGSKNHVILRNTNSSTLSIDNESVFSSASNRIITGTGSSINLSPNASILFIYDLDFSRWVAVGGTGSGSGGGGGGNSVISVTQTNSFQRGEPITYDGTNWVLARANNINNTATAVVLTIGTNFTALLSGEIDLTSGEITNLIGASSFTPGTIYYLSSSTAGKLTSTAPSSIQNIVLIAISSTRAVVRFNIDVIDTNIVEQTFTSTFGQVLVTLAQNPISKTKTFLFLDGVGQFNYTLVDNIITLPSSPPVGTEIHVRYFV